MINRIQFSRLLALSVAFGLVSCATPSSSTTAQLDAKTASVLDAMAAKLSSAKTLRVTATRKTSPGFTVGVSVAQSASGKVVVERPNKLVAHMNTSEGNRDLGFDGSHLIIVDHKAGTHGIAKASGDIDHAVRGIQATYGVSPLLGELLANRPKAALLEGVKTGNHTGTEIINGTECDRLSFTQDGRITWQLWVATADQLPRRISMVYPNGEGGAPLTVAVSISKWELNAPVSPAELIVTPPSNSRALDMIPIQP